MEDQLDGTYSLAMNHGPMPGLEFVTGRLSSYSELASALEDILVPQKLYVGTDALFHPQPPVRLIVNGRRGIPLAKALAKDFTGLERKDTPAFQQPVGIKSSIRINWPGYADYTRQLTINSVEKGKPTILALLAHLVAKEMQRFIDGNANMTGKDRKWQLNSPAVNMNTLLLTEVRHVSAGSIQPTFAVAGSDF